ncbi:NAD(P)H-binding protein [Muriicola marianensis]|nr:NAD(P)H-binding protein [Muriicola marianensis]
MDQPLKTAIILGATGLTGGILLDKLLEDPRYGCVKVFSRSPLQKDHPKLEVHLGDLLSLSDFKPHFMGDEVYCCIGTTKAKTPEKEKYKAIDYGIPLEAAKLSKENGIDTFLVISALGADPGSGIFYNRVKGEMEEAVMGKGISRTYILQPALIQGPREESRPGEWMARKLFSVLDVLLVGPLRKYKSIRAEDIATAMIWLANNEISLNRIVSDTIKDLAHA